MFRYAYQYSTPLPNQAERVEVALMDAVPEQITPDTPPKLLPVAAEAENFDPRVVRKPIPNIKPVVKPLAKPTPRLTSLKKIVKLEAPPSPNNAADSKTDKGPGGSAGGYGVASQTGEGVPGGVGLSGGTGNGSGGGSGPGDTLGPGSGKGGGSDTEADYQANYAINPKPIYPRIAKEQDWTGKVLLRVRVSAEGLSEQVSIHRSSGHEVLDDSALIAVQKWRFVPAKRGGTAVACTVIVPIFFSLTQE